MKSMRVLTVAVAALMAVGCKDMGMNGDWARVADADDRPSTELVTAVNPPPAGEVHSMVMDGRLWVPSGGASALPGEELRAIGTAGEATVYARNWDRPPYDQLFTRAADERGYQSHEPVLGRSGRPDGAAAH